MAFYTDTIESRTRTSAVTATLARISAFFSRMVETQTRSIDVRRMQDLSDAELANMGLNRADIVRHVYRDIYYV
ncbi:DUF1127 domain-containing protein [Yoonia sp. GPGPB17]|uniref:DUF1127 domain-containing protein n=1 Tax=Yoonia sp. GPGPB17 TaxID=3026147 RepID=UPI0030C17685